MKGNEKRDGKRKCPRELGGEGEVAMKKLIQKAKKKLK